MYVARTIRGIEDVAASEIGERTDATMHRTRHREVWFDTNAAPADLLALRTVDDVFTLVESVRRIGRRRDAIGALRDAVATAEIPTPPTGHGDLEVVASFLGTRNYNRYEVEDAVGNAVAAATGLRYWSRGGGDRPPAGAWSWRVTIEDDEAMVGIRLADRPVGQRGDRSRVGALQPPLAAAMAWLAGVRPGVTGTLVDPCAGTGTILIEAGRLAPLTVIGGDLDPGAAGAAFVADAAAVPLRSGAVDWVVANPPWGGQVERGGRLLEGLDALWAECARLLRAGGRAVVLSTADRPGHEDLAVVEERPVSLRGSHPVLVVAERR